MKELFAGGQIAIEVLVVKGAQVKLVLMQYIPVINELA